MPFFWRSPTDANGARETHPADSSVEQTSLPAGQLSEPPQGCAFMFTRLTRTHRGDVLGAVHNQMGEQVTVTSQPADDEA